MKRPVTLYAILTGDTSFERKEAVTAKTCEKIVAVTGGQAFAASRNCAGKVAYIDPKGRGWCKRHMPDEETRERWNRIAAVDARKP